MADLFPPSLDEMIRCVEREIRYRERVYPRRVAGEKMSQQKADREIETMRAILALLRERSEREVRCAGDEFQNLKSRVAHGPSAALFPRRGTSALFIRSIKKARN